MLSIISSEHEDLTLHWLNLSERLQTNVIVTAKRNFPPSYSTSSYMWKS